MLLCTSLLLHITLCLPRYVVGTRVILTEEKNSNPSKGSGKKCPIGYSCPLDTKCIMTKMNKPNCICPYNGRSAIEGVSCQNLELFDSGEIMFADSSDEECNPEEYGCGEQAVCDIHNGEGVCSCPGFGPVPKGQACGSKTDKKGNHSDASDYAVRESTRSAAACKNKHGWVDSFGDDCSWYERNDQRGCPKYGEFFTGKHGKPNEGCCYCGGGVPCWGDGIRCDIGTSCNICCNPYTYWERLLFTACGRDPNPPSCMSGETNLMQVTVGSNGKRSRKIKPRKVKKLNVGDRIQGFNEELKPSNNCKVEAIGTFGTGTFYGNYTKDHFVYNKRTKAIQQHGKMSHSKTTGKTYEVFTSCPLGIDESGTMFTPIDSDFCGRELKSMAWSDYIILYRGILRVVRRTGGYWFNGKTYADMNQLHKYAAPVCRNMLKCMKNPKNCKDFEKSSKLFIENALTGPMKKKTYLKFGMKTNALNTAEYATISAVVTAGESKTKK